MAEDSFELNEINQLIATIQPLPTSAPWLTKLDHPRLCLFSASHGIIPSPQFDYDKFIQGCLSGTGRLNRLAQAANTDLRLYEMDPEDGGDQPAFTTQDLVRCMAYGMMAVEPGLDLMALGAFGPGSREASEALIALHTPQAPTPSDLTAHRMMKQAKGTTGLTALHLVGGFELAALCGSIIAARLANCPVLLEGPAGLAAYLCLTAENPALGDHCRLCVTGQDRYDIGIANPAQGHGDPGLALASLIPLLRTEVILNDGLDQDSPLRHQAM